MCDFDGFDDGWDLDTGDFAILGGIFGYAEEECEEQKRLEREMEKDQERIDEEMADCGIFNPPDDDPYP
jgi:hypothetical protein